MWPSLVTVIRDDLGLNSEAIHDIIDGLRAGGLSPLPTPVRVLDIAVWMAANTSKPQR